MRPSIAAFCQNDRAKGRGLPAGKGGLIYMYNHMFNEGAAGLPRR